VLTIIQAQYSSKEYMDAEKGRIEIGDKIIPSNEAPILIRKCLTFECDQKYIFS